MSMWKCNQDPPRLEYGSRSGGWSLDEDGMLAISDAPGLGLELDMDAVERCAGGETLHSEIGN